MQRHRYPPVEQHIAAFNNDGIAMHRAGDAVALARRATTTD